MHRPLIELEVRVVRTLRRESLVPDQGRVAVALSGGADSVALTSVMRDLASEAHFTLGGVIHLNHQLREAAHDDEHFCRDLAERWSLPIEVGHADVRGRSHRDQISVEEAGHRERYAFFEQAAATLKVDCVATAHTRNDQAETYLMRLVRGAGPAGLSGIHPRSGRVIRPLLDVSRQELRTYLADRGQTFREDETNADLSVTRNRIRHELIPLLEERFSPSVVEALARGATIARHDVAWLETEANEAASRIVTYGQDGAASLSRRDFAAEPVALGSRIAKRLLERVAQATVGFSQVDRFLELVEGTEPTQDVDFPRCRVTRDGDTVVVRGGRERSSPPLSGFEYRLRIPGEVEVPEAGMALSVERSAVVMVPQGLTASSGSAYVSAEALTPPLVVRNWRPGDWLKPLGLGGRKKVQDVFMDRKVARTARQAVPIVADASEAIVWVVGHTVAEDFRVTSGTEGMLILRARKLGGAG